MNNMISFRLWEDLDERLNIAIVNYNEISDGKWNRSDIINLSIQYFYRMTVMHTNKNDLTSMLSIIYSAIETNIDSLDQEDLLELNKFIIGKLKEKERK